MKRCLLCLNIKIFGKLKDGLCPDCYNEYKKHEAKYKVLLKKVTSKYNNKEELLGEIKLLSIELRKYDNLSNTVKSGDCEELINMILSKEDEIKKASPNTLIDAKTNTLEKDKPSKSIDNEKVSETNSIQKNINSQIYKETSSIITTLSNSSLGLNDLCYYSFLLKNTYMPVLKEYHINEVKNINLTNLINNCLNKASTILKLPEDKIYSYYNYIAFSIQTTGVNPKQNEIVEIAAVKISYGNIQDKFHTFICPVNSISIDEDNNVDISAENLTNTPSLKKSLENFRKFIGNNLLVCHNSNYEYDFIKYNYEKIFGEALHNNVEFTLNLYKKRIKEFHGDSTKDLSLMYCCNNILKDNDIKNIYDTNSIALSSSVNIFKLYEVLKTS